MVFILLLSSLVLSLDIDDNHVLIFTDDNFDNLLKTHEKILVEFYAPWCRHCQMLAPAYSKAAQRLLEEDPPIFIGKVDGTENLESTYKYNIEGFPTLKFFVNGEASDYTGMKTEEGIYNWMLKRVGPPTRRINSIEALQMYLNSNELSIVLFTKDSDLQEAFANIAKRAEENCFVICNNTSIFPFFDAQDPMLTVYKKQDGIEEKFEGKFEETDMAKFIERSSTPWLMPFDDKVSQFVFHKRHPCAFLFRPNADAQLYSNMLKKVSNKLRGNILVTYADLADTVNKRLVEYLGFPDSWMPFILYINQNQQKFVYRGKITEKNMLDFFERCRNGTERPYLKSQSLPANEYEDGVRVIVASNFEDVAFNKEFDVFVEFYAPWCGKCKRFASEYIKLAKDLKKFKKIIIAKIDATENEIEGYDFQEFPAFRYFPANNKQGIEYLGKKDAKSIEGFILNNAGISHRIEEL